jgi:hypothetical protein
MVAFSADTEYVLGAATTQESTYASIYRVAEAGNPSVLKFGNQPVYQNITTVDWTNSSNACLLGSVDGTVKVTTLIKV